jgi:long-chain acyl-CoA synthetase
MHEQPCVHYPEGVPRQLPLCSETLVDMLARSARRFSRRPALYFFGKTVSYRECHDLVERFATGLATLGIRKGDRVALCLPNSPQAVIAYFGILSTSFPISSEMPARGPLWSLTRCTRRLST